MKIFSKFHDYYDGVLKYSQEDSDGVYKREEERIFFSYNSAEIKESNNIRWFSDTVKFIGFCGKIYPFIEFVYSEESIPKCDRFFVGYEDVDIEKYRAIGNTNKIWNYINNDMLFILNKVPRDSWYKHITYTNPFNIETFFEKYQTPIFLFEASNPNRYSNRTERENERWLLTTNICLKDYGFQRIVDSFTAFQEISMFFNSILTTNNTPEMPVGSDKVLAASKGFDEWSFRKIGKNSKIKN